MDGRSAFTNVESEGRGNAAENVGENKRLYRRHVTGPQNHSLRNGLVHSNSDASLPVATHGARLLYYSDSFMAIASEKQHKTEVGTRKSCQGWSRRPASLAG